MIAALLKLEALRELTRREKLKDEAMRFKQLQADKKRRIEAKRKKMEDEAASSRNIAASSSGGESASEATTQEKAVTTKKATSTSSLAAMLQESGPQVSEAMKKTTRGAVSAEDLSTHSSSKKSPIILPSSHEDVDRKGEKEKEKEKEKEHEKEKGKEQEKEKEDREEEDEEDAVDEGKVRNVLYFHGNPGSRFFFLQEHAKIAKKALTRVIVVERPGYGLSSPKEDL